MSTRLPSSSAQDRQVAVWFQKIENGEIKLPRFQRHQAWDKNRVSSLLDTVVQNLPLGVTLLLNVDKEQFISRYLATAPQTGGRVTEHLLDGQQRLTALWRSLHNNYDDVKYFVYMQKYDRYNEMEQDVSAKDQVYVLHKTRYMNRGGSLMPLWADNPYESFRRGAIPMNLFKPGDNASIYEKWVDNAVAGLKPSSGSEDYEDNLMSWMKFKNEILQDIRDIREIITHFNLPYLALPSQTSKDTALQVFINMNTNSKPLSQYDIIRAEIEGVKGVSLDEYEAKLHNNHPKIHHYFELPFLILATSALMQDKLPSQRGMWDMQKDKMIENWEYMESGLAQMAEFMETQGVYDRGRLPTNAVLAVIAALYTVIPDKLDKRGHAEILLKRYLWSSFFTDRYENSAATNAYNDYLALKEVIQSNAPEAKVPVFNREKHPLATVDELIKVGWPKRENIRARGIMAVFTALGAKDFADGSELTRQQLSEGKRHYHHVFPRNILDQAETESFFALNCALITDKTNLNISNKEPYSYLQERYDWTSEDIVDTRLKSHLIPVPELKNGGYEGFQDHEKHQKVKSDFEAFMRKRGRYVHKAVELLASGRDISANDIINYVESHKESIEE